MVITILIIVLKIVLRLQKIEDIPRYGHKNDRSHWIIIYWNLVYYYYKMV